jgi:hypothetical protein
MEISYHFKINYNDLNFTLVNFLAIVLNFLGTITTHYAEESVKEISRVDLISVMRRTRYKV